MSELTERERRSLYMILDSGGTPLARGVLETPLSQPQLLVRVLGDEISEVVKHDEVKLIGPTETAVLGRILRARDDRLFLQKVKSLGAEERENFRMPVTFRSFLYPLTGSWKGRREIESVDLSCGGIAFFCEQELAEGEEAEVVVPITEEPLILRCRVIRRRPSDRETPFYATAFVNLCDDEETLVREAVFSVQVGRK